MTSYIEQCRALTPSVNRSILDILMSFVGGVHGWTEPESLAFFGDWFGVPVAPRLPIISSTSSLVRVRMWIQNHEPELMPRNATIGDEGKYCCGVEALNHAWRAVQKLGIDPDRLWQELVEEVKGHRSLAK